MTPSQVAAVLGLDLQREGDSGVVAVPFDERPVAAPPASLVFDESRAREVRSLLQKAEG